MAGISPQSPESHRRFREKYNLPFTLLSDETKEVIRMFGVNGLFGFWVQRVTYLIDQNRCIKGRVKAHFSIAEHEAFISKAIELRNSPEPLVLHAQYGCLADGRHGDDVHRVELLVADRGHVARVAQCRDELRHGVAVSDDDRESAAILSAARGARVRTSCSSPPRRRA